MVTPPLAKPVTTVARSIPPVTRAENTNINRVSAVTGMDRPVVMPLLVVPIATIPVRGGAKVTTAPATGVKILSGVVDSYSWAVIVTSVPTKDNASKVLK